MPTMSLSKLSLDELREMFKEASTTHGETTLSGDYKVGNRAFALIERVYKELARRDCLQIALKPLLFDQNVSVKTWAASRMLPIDTDVAVRVLKEVAAEDNGILSFNARMVLEQWEKGELSFDQEAH